VNTGHPDLGQVTVLGAHILDVLGRPVETIPPGQGSVRLKEIRATAAGTAAGTGVDLAKLGARVLAVGGARRRPARRHGARRHGQARRGHRRAVRKKKPRRRPRSCPSGPTASAPAFHVPGATRLFTRADVDLERIQNSRALLIGAPDALAGLTGEELAQIAGAARNNGSLVAVDVLHPGRPEDLDRLAPLLAVTDWFIPNGDQILALTARAAAEAIKDALALGAGGVAVTLGVDGCLVAWDGSGAPVHLPALEVRSWTPPAAATASPPACSPGSWRVPRQPTPPGSASPAAPWSRPAWARTPGIENLGQVLSFLERTQPAVAGRIRAGSRPEALRSTSHE